MLLTPLLLSLSLQAAPSPRRHHLRMAPASSIALESRRWKAKGVLQKADDGSYVLERPLPESFRRAVSRAQHIPMSAVPRASRQVLLRSSEAPSPARLERWVGREVQAELARDPSGRTYLLGVTSPVP